MSSWDDYTLTCIHGVTEGLDSHECDKCRALTDEEFGPNEPTHLYLERPRSTNR